MVTLQILHTSLVNTDRVSLSSLSTEQMDSLLFQCFLHALKSKVKKSELPLLTGTFLRKHMASCWYFLLILTLYNASIFMIVSKYRTVLKRKVANEGTSTS